MIGVIATGRDAHEPRNSESIDIVIPGPWFIGPTMEIGTGPWLWGENPATGEPGLFLIRGRWVQAEEFTFVGRVVDLCAELAPG